MRPRYPTRLRPAGPATALLISVFSGSLLLARPAPAADEARVAIRGKQLTVHLSGTPGGQPVVLTSGDLGWAGFVVHVAEHLAAHGYRVIGVSSKDYLSAFTSGSSHLEAASVPGDYAALLDLAAREGRGPILLAGVSEGAGLSVLAATTESNRPRIAGVIGLGLPDENELGWRFGDFMTWITKKPVHEPTFFVAEHIARMEDVPLAAIHATHDEFVPLDEVRRLVELKPPPKRLWVLEAANHRFSDNRPGVDATLLEALAWIAAARPAAPDAPSSTAR